MNEALPTFLAECRELLDEMESALLSLQGGAAADHDEAVNAIFRAAHTVKGSAGLFGLDHVVAFTHVAESVLDEVRAGRLSVDGPLQALLLGCCDHIRALVDAIDAGHLEPLPALEAQAAPLLDQLRARLGGDGGPAHAGSAVAAPTAAPSAATAPSTDASACATAGRDVWHLSLRFGAEVLRHGLDPINFIRYLRTLGEIEAIATIADALPDDAAEFDPERCWLGFEIALRSEADQAAIENVFEFVIDDCSLRILAPGSGVAEFAALVSARPEAPERLVAVLAGLGCASVEALNRALEAPASAPPGSAAALPASAASPAAAAPASGALPVAASSTAPTAATPAAAAAGAAPAADKPPRGTAAPAARESASVRVDADKLDRLIDLVGELITAASSASQAARRVRDAPLKQAHNALGSLVREVRDSALQLRMLKIGGTFNRFHRVVHDVSREIGKDIALAISGEDTELDKTVIEKLGDPLTHLVRNAMDHGIGTPEERLARGKPARGTISLNARHDAGSVVIEVGDDGHGLNRERILAKAVQRGMVEPGRAMSDTEVYNLVFEPGFSTAEQVTSLSGRGVGMDVVKRNITAMRGSVSIDSTPAVGTTVTLRLPLTLAMINGFEVQVGNAVFVVPLDVVDECIEATTANASSERDYINLRGKVLPLIRLRTLFAIGGGAGRRENIVVVRHGGHRVGLVVDTLLGEFQTVIRPLSKVFGQVRGISGSSIRGSGGVALILDVGAVIGQAAALATEHHAQTTAA